MEAIEIIQAGRSGVFVVPPDPELARIEQAAAAREYRFFAIDTRQVRNKAEFLHALKTALDFPAHFGNNWDALIDMLRDLSWIPAKGYVILFNDLTTYATDSPKSYDLAFQVLRDAATFWHERKADHPPLIVLIMTS